jgi:hypothetical protein
MKNILKFSAFLLATWMPLPLGAEGLTLELLTGSALNFPTDLTVRQAGSPDLRLTAHYDTDPFGAGTPYYALRALFWEGQEAWEVGMLHQRLFLKDPPPEIQFFAIHYGYNFFLFGRAWRTGEFILHATGGPILTSPENTVRGKVYYTSDGLLGSGYHLSGFGMTGSLSRDLRLGTQTFLVLDVGLSSGWTWGVPVADGSADVPNLALHFHLGFGVDL